MRITAYCPCAKCCGRWADGITASGEPVTADGGCFVAADPAVLPLGSRVIVPGYAAGRPVRVLDTGGAIKGSRLDVFFPTHAEALQWGVKYLDVQVGK
jgi:3D (Asp-Asp-Asp) domain-containing protein